MMIRDRRREKFRLGIERNISNRSLDLYIITEPFDRRGDCQIATSITMETINEGDMYSPIIQITPEEAQQLMDQLWAVGVRPENGAGSQATLDAINAHLKDLQQLVFKNSDSNS